MESLNKKWKYEVILKFYDHVYVVEGRDESDAIKIAIIKDIPQEPKRESSYARRIE